MSTVDHMRRAVAKHSFTWTDVVDYLCAEAPFYTRAQIKEFVVEVIEGRGCRMAVAMAIIELIVKEKR